MASNIANADTPGYKAVDIERAKFSENAVMYEFPLDRVKGHFKHLMEMRQNLND